MANPNSKLGRMGAALLLAVFVTTIAAGCGAGGLGVEIVPKGHQPPPPPPLQGVSIQCDPTSLVVLDSVEIERGGATAAYPTNLPPGQQTFIDLPAGTYRLYGLWFSGTWPMKDSTPFAFTVQPNQVAFVSWK